MIGYNFVILGSPWEFYKRAYSDVLNRPNVEYHDRISYNIVLRTLIHFHLHPKLNKIINLPFKSIWAKKFIKSKFSKKEPLCFIVFYGWICMEFDIIGTIKKQYPNAKIIIVFNDLIKVQKYLISAKPLDIPKLKKQVDYIVSFDIHEADEYGLLYHPIPYSTPENIIEVNDTEFDIYFLGQAKNRLDEILSAYETLVKLGAKVNFILANVPTECQKELPGITYVSGMGVSYQENLQNIANSKCLLEIMQKNGTGYTSRTLEAIAYDKRLLTNNSYILNAPFYNPDYISYFNNPSEINQKFIENLKTNGKVNYNYKKDLSPVKFLDFVQSVLNSPIYH